MFEFIKHQMNTIFKKNDFQLYGMSISHSDFGPVTTFLWDVGEVQWYIQLKVLWSLDIITNNEITSQ